MMIKMIITIMIRIRLMVMMMKMTMTMIKRTKEKVKLPSRSHDASLILPTSKCSYWFGWQRVCHGIQEYENDYRRYFYPILGEPQGV